MKLLSTTRVATITQLRVTPDNALADALRQKQAALTYTPENGFHKDQRQGRLDPTLRPAFRNTGNFAQ